MDARQNKNSIKGVLHLNPFGNNFKISIYASASNWSGLYFMFFEIFKKLFLIFYFHKSLKLSSDY